MSAKRRRRSKAGAPAPWLLASMAAFGVVIGGSTYAGTAIQRRYDIALSRHVVARSALQQLGSGVLDLHDELQSTRMGDAAGADDASLQLATLDAAFDRLSAMPPLAGETNQLAAARTAYGTWRTEHALPVIAALHGNLRLAPNVTAADLKNSGAREATSSVRALQTLAATDDRVRGAQMASDFETFDRSTSALEGMAALGIAAAMSAGYFAVRRLAAQTKRTLLLEDLEPLADEFEAEPAGRQRPAHSPVPAFAFDDGGYAGYPVMAGPGAGEQPAFLYPVPFSLRPAQIPARSPA